MAAMKGEGRGRPNANIHFVRPGEPALNTDNHQLPPRLVSEGCSQAPTVKQLQVCHFGPFNAEVDAEEKRGGESPHMEEEEEEE